MLKYLKKFVLDILPSVVATIVGAYIVHHYVIPAAKPNKDTATISAADTKPALAPDAVEKASFVKGVAEKAAIEKTAEKASEKTGDATASDSKKRHATTRAGKPSAADQTASISESPVTDERRDANDLARAAIERLRPAAEAPRTNSALAALPALPPATTVATPSPEVFNAGTGAIIAPARPAPSVPTHSADATRPMPPEAIPASPPLELHDNIITTATGRAATVADDVMSVAKSVFHAVLPR